jgi:hypothetical protein
MPGHGKRRYRATPTDDLKTLPQFEPDYLIPFHALDLEGGKHQLFAPEREGKIRASLEQLIRPHAKIARSSGRLSKARTRTEPFIETAIYAIARYEYRRSKNSDFDRRVGEKKLKRALTKITATIRALDDISQDVAMTHFLENIYASGNTSAPENVCSAAEFWREQYRAFAPSALVRDLRRLEPVLTLASERMTLQSGDIQRDDIAQEMCEQLVFAWIKATGKAPTVSKPNPRSRNPSPFAKLLSVVNGLLEPRFKQRSAFQNYAIKARDKVLKDFPELRVRRARRGRA